MSREEKVKILIYYIEAVIEAVEGVKLSPLEFKDYTDKELDADLDWYDYLLGK